MAFDPQIFCGHKGRMDILYRDSTGSVAQIFTVNVVHEGEERLQWVGINKSCEAIPLYTLELVDEMSNPKENAPVDEFGHFLRGEYGDTPGWFRVETHYRGWIPLYMEDASDTRPAKSHRDGSREVSAGGISPHSSQIRSGEIPSTVGRSCEKPHFDWGIPCPETFNLECLERSFNSEEGVQRMAAQAKRAVLEIWGLLSWWIVAIPGWVNGMPREVIQLLFEMQLSCSGKVGYLIVINRDWRGNNFPLLVRNEIPIFYVWGLFEGRDYRFVRFDPLVIRLYLASVETREVRGLWSNELPDVASHMELANRYDKYLQLKIGPFSWPRLPIPMENEISGSIKYWVIDAQHWGRRYLEPDEAWVDLDCLYHHIVVEDRPARMMRVIFHRFHLKPTGTSLEEDSSITSTSFFEPNISVIRERFKGRNGLNDGGCDGARRTQTPHDPFATSGSLFQTRSWANWDRRRRELGRYEPWATPRRLCYFP
ncbi:hypothetical protein DFH07DRAFT_779034 [Mycena maculata]|uniref:Uncharacterized protein n=1 Tax=Mycena maculata TaxID=230809 RepID=A0AAD7IA97_9AGAR|nr:hypothetical protein DFH07DRAFT_779034 [Mycena maculata]